MGKEKILIVEDEEAIQELIRYNLNKEGFDRVRCCDSGEKALETALDFAPDLILLDLMLPGIDGLAVCRKLRNEPRTSTVPIIMLTAKGEENDIVLGLEMGADDYITKPYSSKILAARIAVQLRRKQSVAPVSQTITLGPLSMDLTAHSVRLNGELLLLTADEFKTLTLLASNPGRVFTRNQIIREVKGDHYSVTARAIDMHIVNLRRKLGDWADHIETIRGVGYRITGG